VVQHGRILLALHVQEHTDTKVPEEALAWPLQELLGVQGIWLQVG
jgi:hypothetical protein